MTEPSNMPADSNQHQESTEAELKRRALSQAFRSLIKSNAEAARMAIDDEPAGRSDRPVPPSTGEQADRAEPGAVASQSGSVEQTRAGVVQLADGSLIERADDGRIVRTKDARGDERSFWYNPDGHLRQVTGPYGTWTSVDGLTWTSSNGKTWQGRLEVQADGSYHEEDLLWRKIFLQDGTRINLHKPDGGTLIAFRDGTALRQTVAEGKTVRRICQEDGSEYCFLVKEDGYMMPLYQRYATPLSFSFETPEGAKYLKDIREVRYDWYATADSFRLTYLTGDGKLFQIERSRDGKLKSFGEALPG